MGLRKHISIWVPVFLAMTLAGCGADDPPSSKQAAAVAVLMPTEDGPVEGVVRFFKEADGIRVVAQVENLTPGDHGFHIHEFGDCSAPDGAAAGGHYNPNGASHGGPEDENRHVGDFGNIHADDTGKAVADFVDSHLKIEGATSIIGRSIVVHARADDLKSQPAGNAGKRVACGVIGVGRGKAPSKP